MWMMTSGILQCMITIQLHKRKEKKMVYTIIGDDHKEENDLNPRTNPIMMLIIS